MDDHCHVQRGQCVGPVRNDDDDALLAAQRFDRVGERILAFGVEIGVRLVEYDQKRAAEYGPRQANSLALSGRQ